MTKIKLATLLALIAIPSLVLGAGTPPSGVKNVALSMDDAGALHAMWTPATDDTEVAFYRVYFSRKSILQNGGDYDDFEKTSGTEAAYTFERLPIQEGEVFVGVLAVDTDGNESEGFESEASIVIQKKQEIMQEPAAAPEQPTAEPAPEPVLEEAPKTDEAPQASDLSASEPPTEVVYIKNPFIATTAPAEARIESATATKKSGLPRSGIGLFGIAIASGAIAGRKLAKNRAQKRMNIAG